MTAIRERTRQEWDDLHYDRALTKRLLKAAIKQNSLGMFGIEPARSQITCSFKGCLNINDWRIYWVVGRDNCCLARLCDKHLPDELRAVWALTGGGS